MSRAQLGTAVGLIAAAVLGLVYTLVAGNEPLLGLDLQGGVSVVLEPTTDADDETLDQTLEIIRTRVDALGVAEPEISRQGNTIVVDLPGVEEQQRALTLVGQTAELRFRPVIVALGPPLDLEDITLDPDALESTDDGIGQEDGEDEEEGLAPIRERRQTTEGEPAEDDAPVRTVSPEELAIAEACGISGLTDPELDFADRYVVLLSNDGNRLCLGPSLLTGDALETADVGLLNLSTWQVNPVFRGGSEGIDAFNEIAALCFNGSPTCPTRQLAIVLDHQVISAPGIQAPSFARDNINISGEFTEDEARNLALVLRYGALPVELEAQQVRTVSATIGSDVLESGIIAGVIGLALVALYLLLYYRLAALVAIAGIAISGMLIWTIIAWLGETQGLAITLAGIVGLIVSIGVSADSNIVYFENVKDLVAHGRRPTTAVERAYQSAISTIVKADVVSLIAALLLYFLTIGAVKGFAFYLGLATVLDLIVSYFFMRPALTWLATRDAVKANPRLLGLPREEVAANPGGAS